MAAFDRSTTLPAPPPTLPYACPRCGYDLRGSPSRRCPECGFAWTRRQVFRARSRQVDPPFLPLLVGAMFSYRRFWGRHAHEVSSAAYRGLIQACAAAASIAAALIATAAAWCAGTLTAPQAPLALPVVGVAAMIVLLAATRLHAGLCAVAFGRGDEGQAADAAAWAPVAAAAVWLPLAAPLCIVAPLARAALSQPAQASMTTFFSEPFLALSAVIHAGALAATAGMLAGSVRAAVAFVIALRLRESRAVLAVLVAGLLNPCYFVVYMLMTS